jgi:hypothetical protein
MHGGGEVPHQQYTSQIKRQHRPDNLLAEVKRRGRVFSLRATI